MDYPVPPREPKFTKTKWWGFLIVLNLIGIGLGIPMVVSLGIIAVLAVIMAITIYREISQYQRLRKQWEDDLAEWHHRINTGYVVNPCETDITNYDLEYIETGLRNAKMIRFRDRDEELMFLLRTGLPDAHSTESLVEAIARNG